MNLKKEKTYKMSKVTLKYKSEEEFKNLINGLRSFSKIIKISPPKKGASWIKVYVDIELKNA